MNKREEADGGTHGMADPGRAWLCFNVEEACLCVESKEVDGGWAEPAERFAEPEASSAWRED